MSKLISELSVFFPTYNEEGNIEKVVSSTKKVLEKVADKWEIIIVEDGSADKSPEVSDRIAKTDKRIRVIHHKPNRGYGGTLKTGFAEAKYKWVAFTDSDGQFDFADIEKFIAKKDEADLVLGYRIKRADSFLRSVFTFGWATLARVLLGLKARDYSCGFKMIKKEVYQAILPLVGEEKVTQIEMLVKARKKGFRFAEVGVHHYPRASGTQTGANLKVVAKSIVDMFKLWGKLHNVGKKEFFILLGILSVAAFLRLFKIDQYMTFLGDEGRDVIIARRFLTEAHPPLIGPGTSIGNMYLGPLYYYMMALPLLIANFSPVGPAIQIALLGVVTIAFIWYAGREWFGRKAGLIAALLYAISPTVIIYSRSSWNPNIMPFFSMLCVYSIWRVWVKKEYKWIIIAAISFAFAMQSHYLALILIPVLGLFWLLRLINNIKTKEEQTKQNSFFKNSIIGFIVFLLLMSPLAIFDLRHGGINFASMKKFFTERQTTVSIVPWKAIPNMWPIYEKAITRLPGGRNEIAGKVISFSIVTGVIVMFLKKRQEFLKKYVLVFVWLVVSIGGLGLYKQHIYDHYYGFFFAAPFLLVGALSGELLKIDRKYTKVLVGILLVVLVVVNVIENPLKYSPNQQLKRAQVVSKEVIKIAGDEKFNFTIIADSNYDSGYRYFLNLYGANVVDIDPLNAKETIVSQLIVVCETEKKKCDPTHNPKAEVANFGWSKIDAEYEAFGTTIYKLGHAR